jgi:hypothetical protein
MRGQDHKEAHMDNADNSRRQLSPEEIATLTSSHKPQSPPSAPSAEDEYNAKVQAELIRLHEFRKALQEEYQVAATGNANEQQEAARKAHKMLMGLAPDALEALSQIINTGTEANRVSAAKFVIDHVIRAASKDDVNNELRDFLKSLTPRKASTTA